MNAARTVLRSAAVRLTAALVAGAATAGSVALSAPAFGDGTPATPSYGGFATAATATPLRVEVYEPAIPIPASPQAELNFSYTHVTGSSGPSGAARASALWPGDAVGEGLKTIVTQAGLPAALAQDGYPVQVNAQAPGSPSSQTQEFFPGMTGRVSADDTGAVARAGYSVSGKVAGDGTSDGSSAGASTSSLLSSLQGGDLSAFGSLIGAAGSNAATPAPTGSPLGALSVLVDAGGMSSSSRTSYAQDSVTATATSQLGTLSLLGGLVTLDGLTTTSTSTSRLAGATTTSKSVYGGMTIANVPFQLTSDGIEAAGSTTAIPGLSDSPTKALAQLGISIDLPKPTKSVDGSTATSSAVGPTVTLDTQPALKLLRLDKLPLADIVTKLPDSAGQLKSLLLAALQAHPKIVIKAGAVSSSAQTVPPIDITTPGGGSSTPPAGGPTGGGSAATGGGAGALGGGGGAVPSAGGAVDASGAVPTTSTPITPVSAVPGLPPLGSVPGLLTLGAVALAIGLGWWLRHGLAAVFGGAGTCAHGLQSGLPDLRKV